MKNIYFLIFLSLIFCLPSSLAINTHVPNSINESNQITVGQFLALDIDQLTESKLINLNWAEKSILKGAQKRLSKKLAKGKVEANQKLFAKASSSGKNKRGMISMILGGAGLLFLWLGALWILSLPMGIAGLIIGIKGTKKDENDALSIVGIVLSSIVILFFLLLGVAIGALASL